jgi:serine/threonine protein kinase
VADKTYTLCGTPNYLSPEMIMMCGHDTSTDHWALGILIYEMVAGESPFYFDGIEQMELLRCIIKEPFYPLPDSTTDACVCVVDGLLKKDPTHRLGSLAGRGKDIMSKDWFKGLELDDLRQKKFTAPYMPEAKNLSGSDSD